MILRKMLSYLNVTRKQPAKKGDLNLKMMHGINRISIFMFLIAVIIMIVRALR